MKTKGIYLLLLFCMWMVTPLAYTKTNVDTLIQDPAFLKAAQAIKGTGVLQMDKRHYVYLAVSNAFIDTLYPLLYQQLDSIDKKCLESEHNQHGAHVTLFYPHELRPDQMDSLPINSTYDFQVIGLHKFDVNKGSKHVVWFVLQIQSVALNEMMQSIRPISKSNFILHISIARAQYNADNSCYAPSFYRAERKQSMAL